MEESQKTCTLCGVTKSSSEFSPSEYRCRPCNNARVRGYDPSKKKANAKKWREDNPDRMKEINRKSYLKNHEKRKAEKRVRNRIEKTGCTPEMYEAKKQEQSSCCAICGRHQSEFKREMPIDHCHKTGQIRSILCDTCNTGLGQFQDSPELLQAAADYLFKWLPDKYDPLRKLGIK